MHLPHEVLLNIFNRLRVEDLLNCAQVCSYWRLIVHDPILWKVFVLLLLLLTMTITITTFILIEI